MGSNLMHIIKHCGTWCDFDPPYKHCSTCNRHAYPFCLLFGRWNQAVCRMGLSPVQMPLTFLVL